MDKPLELFSGSSLLLPLAFLFDADMTLILNFDNLHVLAIMLLSAVSYFASQYTLLNRKSDVKLKDYRLNTKRYPLIERLKCSEGAVWGSEMWEVTVGWVCS